MLDPSHPRPAARPRPPRHGQGLQGTRRPARSAPASTHAEWLALLLEHEATLRRQKRFESRARAAKLRHAASVEDVDYRAVRGLDRALFLKLAGCDWIRSTAQSADHRAVRRRQELARLRARAKGLPGGPLRRLSPRAAPVRRPGARRAAMAATPGCCASARPRRPAHPRRLGTRAARPPSSAATSWRSSRIATTPARSSSPARCPSTAGTKSSATPRSPTPSSTASSTTPTGSNSPARACAKEKTQTPSDPPLDPTTGPDQSSNQTQRKRRQGWPASDRNPGRLRVGIAGRLQIGMHGRLRRNPHSGRNDLR